MEALLDDQIKDLETNAIEDIKRDGKRFREIFSTPNRIKLLSSEKIQEFLAYFKKEHFEALTDDQVQHLDTNWVRDRNMFLDIFDRYVSRWHLITREQLFPFRRFIMLSEQSKLTPVQQGWWKSWSS